MGERTRDGERQRRTSASAPVRRLGDRRSRALRYGLRAVVLAGAAGAAWFLGSQVASASPAQPDRSAESNCSAGLLPATTQAVGSTLHNLTCGGSAAGDKTCERRNAGSHPRVAAHTAPVANSTCSADAGHGAAASTTRQADSACTRPNRPSTDSATTPSGRPAAGASGPAPLGQLADATSPVLGPVTDATRPVTEPVTTAVRPIVGGLNQSPVIGALTDVTRPVTTTVADTTRPVTDNLTGPLVSATRPVTGLLGAAVPPLPGMAGDVATPVTGVLTGEIGPLSGLGVPTLAAPHQASWLGRHLPAGGLARPADSTPRCASDSFATWTGTEAVSTGFGQLDTDDSVPGAPAPAPLGTGATSGGSAVSAASHAQGGAFAPAGAYAAHLHRSLRVRPAAAPIGLPRLSEADPVVSPD